ncbi:hypothetical protein C7438_0215 [Brockia lithotrophica]|uniref:Uncharacterized protein n=1 Tax=Brockia lithotrophica TaxID=933949 RepID=A0A660L3U6_9BACL|nr:hypothetical protein C7438_0215 [Brockia lithotrophica]
MHEVRVPRGTAGRHQIRVDAGEEAVPAFPREGMNEEPRRFIDHENVRVFVGYGHGTRNRLYAPFGRRRKDDLHALPRSQNERPTSRRPGAVVYADTPRLRKLTHEPPGKPPPAKEGADVLPRLPRAHPKRNSGDERPHIAVHMRSFFCTQFCGGSRRWTCVVSFTLPR